MCTCIGTGRKRGYRFTSKGDEIIDHNWNQLLLEADTVVNALGMKEMNSEIEPFLSLVPETYIIGDSADIGNIRHATQSAFIYAVEC
jgi:hypothetical protein